MDGLLGTTATVASWDGVRGMVRCHGETWSAHSDALPPPERGDRVCVLAVEHLTLEVVKTKDEEK